MEKYSDIARMIDHSLLHPTLTDKYLRAGCMLARKLGVASVCIKPYAVRMAAEILKGSSVAVGTVVGFPHGNSTVSIKADESEQACRDGASELDMVVNIGKVLSEDWEYIENEIRTVAAIAKKHKAILKVIFENDFLSDDGHKVKLCEICSRANVDFVKTSTGYGFVKGEDGKYSYRGATDHDLRLMREHTAPAVQVKAAGGIATLADVIRVRRMGVTRIGASATQSILKEAENQSF